MTTLLHIASRVEAAEEVYSSVRSFTDKAQWKAKFEEEMVSFHLHGISIALHLK